MVTLAVTKVVRGYRYTDSSRLCLFCPAMFCLYLLANLGREGAPQPYVLYLMKFYGPLGDNAFSSQWMSKLCAMKQWFDAYNFLR